MHWIRLWVPQASSLWVACVLVSSMSNATCNKDSSQGSSCRYFSTYGIQVKRWSLWVLDSWLYVYLAILCCEEVLCNFSDMQMDPSLICFSEKTPSTLDRDMAEHLHCFDLTAKIVDFDSPSAWSVQALKYFVDCVSKLQCITKPSLLFMQLFRSPIHFKSKHGKTGLLMQNSPAGSNRKWNGLIVTNAAGR